MSYDRTPPSLTSLVGKPPLEKKRFSWAPNGSGCQPVRTSSIFSEPGLGLGDTSKPSGRHDALATKILIAVYALISSGSMRTNWVFPLGTALNTVCPFVLTDETQYAFKPRLGISCRRFGAPPLRDVHLVHVVHDAREWRTGDPKFGNS